MAKSATAPRQVKMRIKPVVKASRRAISRAFDRVVKEMHASIKKKISKPYPPASTPGSYPHMRRPSKGLANTFEVKRKGYEIIVRTPQYGTWLEGGTGRMRARPWIRRNVHGRRREWSKKITKYAKQAMK